jgi:hypothetical protein
MDPCPKLREAPKFWGEVFRTIDSMDPKNCSRVALEDLGSRVPSKSRTG